MIGIIGNLTWDVIDGGPRRIGGGVYHGALALRAMGQEGRLVTKGPPEESVLWKPLVRVGLPVTARSGDVAVFHHDNCGESRSTRIAALGSAWTSSDVREWVAPALRGIAWIHVAALERGEFLPETLAALAHRRRISFDAQGLVRLSRTGPLEIDPNYDPAMLTPVSILKLSAQEAELLVDGLDERALRRLGVPEIVVTLGSRGCVVFADGIAELVRARRVPSADPTGAGDAFAAAYLAARSRGNPPIAAARRAAGLVADLLAGRAA